jgi:uncharacterized membrane protein
VRWPVTFLAFIGCAVSTYLTLYQWHVTGGVWDPLFGTASSETVLTSSLSRALPVPDATLGAYAYLVVVVLSVSAAVLAGHVARRLELALDVMVLLMAATGVVLVLVQLLVVHALCSLCLGSAAVSWIIAVLVRPVGGLSRAYKQAA